MTAKRFYYAHGIIFDTHKDNHVNKIGTIKDLDTGLRIVDWLNELHEENEHLKQSFNEVLKDLEVTTFDKELLEKENEQLKHKLLVIMR